MRNKIATKKGKSAQRDVVLWSIVGSYVAGIAVTLAGVAMVHAPGLRVKTDNSDMAQFRGSIKSAVLGEQFPPQGSPEAGVNGNLLSNGNFEGPIIRSQSRLVPSSTPALGWDVSWTNGKKNSQSAVEFLSGYRDWKAQEGAQYARLDIADLTTRASKGPSLVTLKQTVQTEDKKYTLKFWYAPQPGTATKENQVTIRFAGQVVDTISIDGVQDSTPDWKEYSFEVKGSGGADELQFIGQGNEDGRGNLLDNVSLVPVE